MIAVIKGDIVASRKFSDTERWLEALKNVLSSWGNTPQQWELVWGDSFQLEIDNPLEALKKAFMIKAAMKKVTALNSSKKAGPLDVRMSIGIGKKTFAGKRISESNGPAFVYAGDIFEKLSKEKTNLIIKSPWPSFDQEINLYLKLGGTIMDGWSVSSAELALIVFKNPKATQVEIGRQLGIKQNSVSDRRNRAKIDDILRVESVYRNKLQKLLNP